MRSVLVGVILCLVALPVSAQVEAVVSRDVAVFAAGVDPATGGSPISAPVNYLIAAAVCSQVKVTPAGVQNPTQVRFDDPANVALDCVIGAASTQLAAVPLGNGYRVAVRNKGATTTSAWGALSNPFDRVAGTVPVPTGVRVYKP